MTPTERGGARDKQSVIATIRHEHRSMNYVVELLEHLLGSIAAPTDEPDFELLSVCLNYLKEYPGRCHHPKEDRYLFKAIRTHAPEHATVLNQLEAEHILDTRMLRALHSALVGYRTGAADGLQSLREQVGSYSAMLHAHTRTEEWLLSALGDEIPASEWQEIADAFATNGDPLFGPTQQREFDRVRERIKSCLPERIRFAMGGTLS